MLIGFNIGFDDSIKQENMTKKKVTALTRAWISVK